MNTSRLGPPEQPMLACATRGYLLEEKWAGGSMQKAPQLRRKYMQMGPPIFVATNIGARPIGPLASSIMHKKQYVSLKFTDRNLLSGLGYF